MRLSVAVAVSCLAIGTLSAAEHAAAAIRKQTTIAPQGLGPALKELAKDRDFQILYRTELVGERQTAGAVGEFTLDEALQKLLNGTDLTFQYLDDNTITVIPAQAGTQAMPVTPPRLNATSSEAASSKNERSFWDRFRLAQAADANAAVTEPTSTQSSAESDPRWTQIEEVIVTAQKRSERLIDVPQAVSVLSSDYLAKTGATQFRDWADLVPGLNYSTQGVGFTQISLRGVTAGVDIGPTIGIYVDDVPYGSSTQFSAPQLLSLDLALFDLDRVEVLRGPQGTLYGASTMGGLIKYVTRQPNPTDFGVEIQTGVAGTQNGGMSYNGAAALNAPLVTDRVGLRVSGFFSHDGGYIDNVALSENDVNESDIYGGRVDLLLAPTEALSVRLTGFAQDIDRNGEATADFAFLGEPLTGALEQQRFAAERFDSRFRLASAALNYDFGSSMLTSISSYQTVRVESGTDFTTLFGGAFPSALQFSDQPTDKVTQEVRLASQGTRRLEWLVGGFYTREKTNGLTDYIFRDSTGALIPNQFFRQLNPSLYKEYAAFGDLTWRFTDKFDATAGIRLAHNSLEFEQIGLVGIAQTQPSTKSSDDVPTYLANARYHFNDRATGYVRYATGYRPGGPNFATVSPVTGENIGPESIGPDRLKSYEVGVKVESADRRFGADFAIYYIDWNDIHTNSFQDGFAFLVNARGGAEIRGTELSFTARPAPGFVATGALAYQDAQMSEADEDLGADEGERLPKVPRFTAALSGDYELPLGELKPTVGVTLRHASDRTTNFGPSFHVPEYTVIDLRGGLRVGTVAWQLYVRNVFDEDNVQSASILGTVRAAVLQPRTIGLSASMSF